MTRSLGPQLLARGPSGLLTCPLRPSGAQAKGHTHRTLTIYDALAIDDAAEILLRTDKAILGVGYRVTGPVGIQCALPKSCQESCSYHTNHSWNMLNRFLCNMCRCGIQCAIPKRCQKSCSSPHSSHHSYNMLKRFLSTMCRCRILCDIPKRLQKSCIYHTNHN